MLASGVVIEQLPVVFLGFLGTFAFRLLCVQVSSVDLEVQTTVLVDLQVGRQLTSSKGEDGVGTATLRVDEGIDADVPAQ